MNLRMKRRSHSNPAELATRTAEAARTAVRALEVEKSPRMRRAGAGLLALTLLAALAAGLYLWWQRRREDEEYARLMRAPIRPDGAPGVPPPPAPPAVPTESVRVEATPAEAMAATTSDIEVPEPALATTAPEAAPAVEAAPATREAAPPPQSAAPPAPAFSQVEPAPRAYLSIPNAHLHVQHVHTHAREGGAALGRPARAELPFRAATAPRGTRPPLPGGGRALF
jgi:hypothetical protein